MPLLLYGDFAGSSLVSEAAAVETLPTDDDGESDGIVKQFAAANKVGPCGCSRFKDPELERRCVLFARRWRGARSAPVPPPRAHHFPRIPPFRRYQTRRLTLLFWPTVAGEVFILTSTALVWIAHTANMWELLQTYALFGVTGGGLIAHFCIAIAMLLVFLASIALALVPWIVGAHPHGFGDLRRCTSRASPRDPIYDVEAALHAGKAFHPEHHPKRKTHDVPQCTLCCMAARGGGIKFCTLPLATGLPETVGRCRTRTCISVSTLLMPMAWNLFIPLTNALLAGAQWSNNVGVPEASCPSIPNGQALERGIHGLLESVLSEAGSNCAASSALPPPLNNGSAIVADVMACTELLSRAVWTDLIDYISVECLQLCTVTFHANPAHSLTPPPGPPYYL